MTKKRTKAAHPLLLALLLVVAAVGTPTALWRGWRLIQEDRQTYPIPPQACKGSECDVVTAKIAARQAAIAETSNILAVCQLALGLVGGIGLGVTLIYAHGAWRAAERSAEAAQDALEDARVEAAEQSRRFSEQLATAALSAEAAAKNADAMVKLADHTAEMMVLEHRPWVPAEVEIASPLRYTAEGAQITFLICLRNMGKSPAYNVFPHASIVGMQKILSSWPDLEAVADAAPNRLLGLTIFPNEKSRGITYTLDILSEELDEISVGLPENKFLPMYLAGSIIYKGLANRVHHTRFSFSIMRKSPADPKGTVIIARNDGDVALDQLVLKTDILFSVASD